MTIGFLTIKSGMVTMKADIKAAMVALELRLYQSQTRPEGRWTVSSRISTCRGRTTTMPRITPRRGTTPPGKNAKEVEQSKISVLEEKVPKM